MPGTAGETDETLVQLGQERRVEGGLEQLALPSWQARMRVRRGQQPAEIRVALRRLDEQRHVRAVGERNLRARDRPHAERLRRMRKLERAVHPVVIGERKRLVAELRRPRRELLRL